MTAPRTIPTQHIVRAYAGRPGCACGCKGTYYCASAESDESEGATYNPGMVTKIARIVATDPTTKLQKGFDDEKILFLEFSPTRNYTLYLSPDADVSEFA